jgi:hypothetical protein
MSMTGPALSSRSAVHLRRAVTDGPVGVQTVGVPGRREAAWRLRAAHPEGFWCSSTASGCGQKLILAAGQVLPPYFRHARGQIRDCVSFHDEHALDRGYLHLTIQLQLHRWLREQGYEVTLEHRFTDSSRADVHVTGRRSSTAPTPADERARRGAAHGHNATSALADDVYMRWLVRDPDAGLALDFAAGQTSPALASNLEDSCTSSV